MESAFSDYGVEEPILNLGITQRSPLMMHNNGDEKYLSKMSQLPLLVGKRPCKCFSFDPVPPL